MDNRTADLELIIEGDPAIATTVLESFNVRVTRPEPTRFIAEASAIIGVASGLVQLVKALVDLAAKLRKDPQGPHVVARNLAGEQLVLNEADDEQIASFVHSSADEAL
jgi:hypothetical protein